MTYYYYLAADIPLRTGIYGEDGFQDITKLPLDHILSFQASVEKIRGFDYPIQIEIYNGVEKDKELHSLLDYIQEQMSSYKVCTLQIANLLNSNRTKFKIRERSKLLLHEITSPNQLLLPEGHLLTVKKVPTFN